MDGFVRKKIMKLYKQKFVKNCLDNFTIYEIVNNCKELHIRSGTCGKKIKESTKSFSSEVEATKTYNKLLKNKLKSGFFECEGDDNRPILPPPFSLGSAPQDFANRISQLADIGVYLTPNYHTWFAGGPGKYILPLHSTSLLASYESDITLISTIIHNTEVVKETLVRFKETEIDNFQYTNDQWERKLTYYTESYWEDWKIIDKHSLDLGIVAEVGGVDSIDLNLDVLNEPNHENAMFNFVRLEPGYNDYNRIEEWKNDYGYDSSWSEIAKLYINHPTILHTQLLHWLFNDICVSVYDITTSAFYASYNFNNVQAIRAYIIKESESNRTHVYFHEIYIS